ncbi:hypothetical protein DNTS_015030 [Danionella cerebrum]|uniref:Uncharacterized protein n=1 Tax=Danionella cerebrum TaxID=2873325 RepID=A0A553QFU7_9TELE|nr:hypothetical protein DNTS_015030 [Danionella translucida]
MAFYTRQEGYYPYYLHNNNPQRRIQLHNDLQSQQRNHQLNRAALLQSQWLEVSEQERRAHIHNQKLLQDFQRAQDTLSDMVAQTEAMNTVRMVQKHLKSYIQQMEEDEGHMSDAKAHPVSSRSSDPSQTSPMMLNSHQTVKDMKHNTERLQHLCLQPTWLTGPPLKNIPKDSKNIQNTQAWNQPSPSYFSFPRSSVHSSHPPFLQKTPSGEWQGLVTTANFSPGGGSWILHPLTDEANLLEEGPSGEVDKQSVPQEKRKQEDFLRERRSGKDNGRSSELDSKPVRLSVDREGSSEGSSGSSEIIVPQVQKQRKKKRNEAKSQSSEDGNRSPGGSPATSENHTDTKMEAQDENPHLENPQSGIISVKKDESAELNSGEEEESNDEDDIIFAVEIKGKGGIHMKDKEKPEMENVKEGTAEEEETQVDKEISGEKAGQKEGEEGERDREDTGDGEDSTEEDERENSFLDGNEARDVQGGGGEDKENIEKAVDTFEACVKCSDDDDDDDDIEDLLNPFNSHKEQSVEVTDQSDDHNTDPEEDPESLPEQKLPPASDSPMGSDEEFDHFYD